MLNQNWEAYYECLHNSNGIPLGYTELGENQASNDFEPTIDYQSIIIYGKGEGHMPPYTPPIIVYP